MLRKDTKKSFTHPTETADPEELARFSRYAEEWWKPDGAFKVVHAFNEMRTKLLARQLPRLLNRDPDMALPLTGVKVLDVGCGAGLVAEQIAILGADVTGIDATEKNIAVAIEHADQNGLQIDYRHAMPENFLDEGEGFDIVLSLEVVEHVANLPKFLEATGKLVAPGGKLAVATINRTIRSFFSAIVGAEYVLRLLPRGTHDWRKFVTPDELKKQIVPLGFFVGEIHGVGFNPLNSRWRTGSDTNVGYMQFFHKHMTAS